MPPPVEYEHKKQNPPASPRGGSPVRGGGGRRAGSTVAEHDAAVAPEPNAYETAEHTDAVMTRGMRRDAAREAEAAAEPAPSVEAPAEATPEKAPPRPEHTEVSSADRALDAEARAEVRRVVASARELASAAAVAALARNHGDARVKLIHTDSALADLHHLADTNPMTAAFGSPRGLFLQTLRDFARDELTTAATLVRSASRAIVSSQRSLLTDPRERAQLVEDARRCDALAGRLGRAIFVARRP